MQLLPLLLRCLALGPSLDRDRGGLRVNKIFGEKYSRREADRFVVDGCVTINGRVAQPGDMVSPNDFVKLNGKRLVFPGQVASAATYTAATFKL